MAQKLNNHFVPRKNHVRFRLKQNQQNSHQTIMGFYPERREFVRECQYGNMKDKLLLDHLKFEVKDDKLRERATEYELNFQGCLDVLT